MRRMVVNGELVDGERVSLSARGEAFAYGFGLFETVKFIDGRPCFFAEHFARMERSAAEAGLTLPFSESEAFQQALSLFEANGVRDGVFKWVAAKPESSGTTDFFVFVRNEGLSLSADPIRLRLSSVVKSSVAFTSRAKTLNYLENWLELNAAQNAGYDECVYCNELGELTECSMSNLFFFKGGALRTPVLECGLLAGTIRAQVIRIAGEMGIRVEEGRYSPEELEDADEAFVTSSGKGIVAVSRFGSDERPRFPDVDSKLIREIKERLRQAERDSLAVFKK